MPTEQNVRGLRYALACALADAVDQRGRPRRSEALEELDRALAESGSDPPDARIKLAAGRLLEPVDQAAALERYLSAVDGDAADDALERATALLAATSDAAALLGTMPPAVVHQIVDVARRQPGGRTGLLGAALLRTSGRDGEALELLQRSDATGKAAPEVAVELAETLLDAQRPAEALAVIDRRDPDGKNPKMRGLRALALLFRGELAEALGAATAPDGVAVVSRTAAAARALALVGLGSVTEALDSLPARDDASIAYARTVAHLSGRGYAEATKAAWSLLRARPTDPDALLINAQTTVEALGAISDDGGTDGSDTLSTPGEQIDAARALLSEVARQLETPAPSSRWWRAQAVVRRNDGRYAFFCCLLQHALGSDPSVEELDAVDRSTTTYLQDAALEELKAAQMRAGGDFTRAAEAHDAACALFRARVVDATRAAAHARQAYELAPTVVRALECARRVLDETYDTALDAGVAAERLHFARDALLRSLNAADDDDDVLSLVNLSAWIRLRTGALPLEDVEIRPRALVRWLFAGVAAQPDDVQLRSVLASTLGDVGHNAAALALAMDAFADSPDHPYVAEEALIAAVNFYGDAREVDALLSHHATLSEDRTWRDAIELHLRICAGDREGIAELLDRAMPDAFWAKRDHAVGVALLRGIPAAAEELAEALDAGLAETPPALSEAGFLAMILDRRADAERLVHEAAADVDADEREVASRRLALRFLADPEMTPETYLDEALECFATPVDVHLTVNVSLPLLVAVKASDGGSVAPVAVDERRVADRLHELQDVERLAREDLGRHRPPLAVMLDVASRSSGPAALLETVSERRDAWPAELPQATRDRLERIVLERAWAAVPRRMLTALLGRREPPSSEDVRLAHARDVDVPRATRCAIAMLAGGTLAAEDVDVGAEEILRLARGGEDPPAGPLVASVEEYWALDEVLARLGHEARNGHGHALAATRATLAQRLDDLLRINEGVDEWEREPFVRPTTVEVGDELVRLVDSSVDGGTFLYELLPAMRERIGRTAGVMVPGLRMRANPGLAPDGFRVLVDEVPVLADRTPLDGSYAVEAALGRAPAPDVEVSDFHPLTGEPGVYVIRRRSDGEGDGDAALQARDYLVHRIECVVRTRLARYLGPAEVATLVEGWDRDDRELVAAVLPDDDAHLRLTWLLQALVDENVPITDWRALLESVREAGGIGAPLREQRRAVRARLRGRLPGPATGKRAVPVPDALERAVVANAPHHAATRGAFVLWLRDVVAEHGPAITLVTQTAEGRETLGSPAWRQDPRISTLSQDELKPA